MIANFTTYMYNSVFFLKIYSFDRHMVNHATQQQHT